MQDVASRMVCQSVSAAQIAAAKPRMEDIQ